MKFTINWLKEHLDITTSIDVVIDKLTAVGLEVEEVINKGEVLAPFKVAEIINTKPHPDADKLKICTVNTGNGGENLQIVCGAENARTGIKVVLATVGVNIPNGDFKIKKSKIRGVESNGMMCSQAELGLGDDHSGIIELDETAEVGKSFADIVGGDIYIEIAITPNRGDCLGVRGIARDLAAAGCGTLKPLKYNEPPTTVETPEFIKFLETNHKDCPLFLGRYFKEVKNTESPKWLKDKLESIGLKSISALVDITNYICYDLNRPLHVFDADKIQGNLTIRPSKKGEKFTALDDETYTLEDDMIAIADDSGVISLGGVIGGASTSCTTETTNVLLEVALFNPITIAKTARALKIETDAKHRFERSVDPAFAMEAVEIASDLIVRLCGGETSGISIAGQEPKWERTISFNPEKIKKLTGVEVDEKRALDILDSLGFDIEGEDNMWVITPPSWRQDIDGEADIVEEIMRIYGYEDIPEIRLNTLHLPACNESLEHKRNRAIKNSLASRGLKEACTWSFIKEDFAKLFGADNPELKLSNAISSEMDYMRPSLLPNLISAVAKNSARGFSNLALFEMGNQFSAPTPEGHMLAVSGIRSGENAEKNIYENRKVDIFDAKTDIFSILKQAGLNPPIEATAPSWYHPARSGTFRLGKNILGYFGEIHPSILKGLKIKTTVVGFELFLDNLPKPKEWKAKKPLVSFYLQTVERDFAFLVDIDTPAEEIIKAVKKADKKLISKASLFDVYVGDKVGDDKKSIAVAVTLQPTDKTLTDEEIEAISQNIVSSVQKNTGGELREI